MVSALDTFFGYAEDVWSKGCFPTFELQVFIGMIHSADMEIFLCGFVGYEDSHISSLCRFSEL